MSRSLLPVEPAWRLAGATRGATAGSSPACGPSRPSASSAANPSAASRSSPSTWPSPSPPASACLRRFAVPHPGRVLLYAAEDALHIVRRASRASAPPPAAALADLDIQVITAPTVRLDLRRRSRAPRRRRSRALQPRLLILDPFVRLHRIDENASGEVAPLLAYLRELQRRHAVAVLVVHHARKGAANLRAGQALRGSSEFHAWGDSNLYLRRDGRPLSLTVEHRAAPSPPSLALELHADGDALALRLAQSVTEPPPAPASVDERITAALLDAAAP